MKIRKSSFVLLFILINMIIFAANEKGLKIKKIKGNSGKRFAICIGVNDYEDENIGDLKKAQNDALALGKVLTEKGQFDKVITMVNDFDHFQDKLLPTKDNIIKRLDFILEFSSPEDLVVISFSGHGISDDKGEGYLITLDTNIEDKFDTSLKVSEIVEKLKQYNIKKSLLILDACREEMTKTKSLKDSKGLLNEKFKESELAATFYSTKAGWFSYEDEMSDYGVFTRFLLQGLDGFADLNKDRVVSFNELEMYVQQEVNEYSLENNRKQKPYTKIYGEKYGDLALTTYLTDELPEDYQTDRNITSDVLSLRASLKADREFDTIILGWSPPSTGEYDGFMLLRQENAPIKFIPKNHETYLESEKIVNTNVIVVKIFDKSTSNYIDSGLKENTNYYYKIYSIKYDKRFPNYSSPGAETSVKTKANVDTIKVNFDSLRVIEVLENSWGIELYWKIEIITSTGDSYTLSERPREKHWATMEDREKNFRGKESVVFDLPKKDNSYFEILVDMWDRDDVKDGWLQERGGEDHLIKRKSYRYDYNDPSIYKTHSIIEQEKNAAKVELKWTISKEEK